MQFIEKLPDTDELIAQYPLSDRQKNKRMVAIEHIKRILDGRDKRKLLLIGPCSADREDAVIEYIRRLSYLQQEVAEKFLIIPRVYTSKPRTTGTGYKGMLHRPDLGRLRDDLLGGLIATRKLHLHVIEQTGMFCVDEMLYPEIIYYILDLVACLTVGARSVENQEHRMVASGVEVPVGMKNPMSGDISVMLNAILAAQVQQSMIYHEWIVNTAGNPYTFAVLRGYIGSDQKAHPNYHYENLCELYDQYQLIHSRNMSVIIDCNHSNSNKCYERQIRISKEIIDVCSNEPPLNRFVKGLMLESYLEDGAQLVGNGIYGKSVTDPCLGWEKTRKLILELAEEWSIDE